MPILGYIVSASERDGVNYRHYDTSGRWTERGDIKTFQDKEDAESVAECYRQECSSARVHVAVVESDE
jgi:hypothetical protein